MSEPKASNLFLITVGVIDTDRLIITNLGGDDDYGGGGDSGSGHDNNSDNVTEIRLFLSKGNNDDDGKSL